ncbi:MAG: hypothetical protein JWN86_3248 [Planctomycetota bacterium]|nr:hypothetical protein [Planctomycetota bacterium]
MLRDAERRHLGRGRRRTTPLDRALEAQEIDPSLRRTADFGIAAEVVAIRTWDDDRDSFATSPIQHRYFAVRDLLDNREKLPYVYDGQGMTRRLVREAIRTAVWGATQAIILLYGEEDCGRSSTTRRSTP